MMKRKWFGTKTYFARMVLWISAAVLLLVLVLSLVEYISTQKLLLRNESTSNQKILYQIEYNMDVMDESIQNLSKFLFVNGDVASIMYAKTENMADVATRLNNIVTSLVTANPYIHSVSIYNRNLDQFYNVGSSIFFKDPFVDGFYNANQMLPVLKPVIRNIQNLVNGKTVPERVFSYFIYSSSINSAKPDGVVVVNVKPAWLINNIVKINSIDPKKGDRVYVLDDAGEFLESNNEQVDYKMWLKNEYMNYATSHVGAQKNGFFESKYEGAKLYITYVIEKETGLTLIKTQPVNQVFQSIERLKTTIVLITLIFVVLALILSFSISRSIYKPFDKLVHSVMSDRMRRSHLEEVDTIDELSYLGTVYKQSMVKLEHFNQEKFRYQNVMKNYWLNRIMSDGLTLSNEELKPIFAEMRISLPLAGPYALILMKIDKYKDFKQNIHAKDQETIRYAISNIASEIVGRTYSNEGLDMMDDQVVLIVRIPDEEHAYSDAIHTLMQEVQDHVYRYFKVTLSCMVSDTVDALNALADLYNQSLNQAMYRFIFGHSSIITSEMIKRNSENKQMSYDRNLEETFLQALKAGNASLTGEHLQQIFNEIGALSYNNALVSVIRFVDAVKDSLTESKFAATSNLSTSISAISRSLLEKETISEIRDLLQASLQDAMVNDSTDKHNEHNYYIVDAVKEYIHLHYRDLSLNLPSIAATMKISARQLSKIFRESMDISIPDYINKLRMEKAAELLVDQQISVREIVEQVGFVNESYFFSLFKKRFHVTPREYALQKKTVKLYQGE
ncbi:AraC-like DNA-binding protein [Paenibacillus qinlingensis]|uniref:AraC-like DNA-binding protein n=2 Tax=Paenibacillus qinlingensis TaxID=1837343 RepID=A0ABU1NSW2_9BACL|nr:AraC-like DNA-binding protein [Paenibacillus qinlingensis]